MGVTDKLLDERRELVEKASRLSTFLKSGSFGKLTEHHKHLLKRQYYVMNEYIDILNERITDLVDA